MADVKLDEATRQRYLRIVGEETERMDHIISDLLGLARAEGGGGVWKREPVSVAALFERVLHRHDPVLQEKSITLDRRVAPDADIVAAFDRIDAARGDTSLTFFEWNALAALVLMEEADLDVAVLEVGLGGRHDAVNAVDADVAAVVSVGLDHCEWLGPTVEDIGREKAGIFREGRPAIFGSRAMPWSVASVATAVGARLRRLGVDFDLVERPDGWDYVGTGSRRAELPLPALGGAGQRVGAAPRARVAASPRPCRD